MVEKQNKQFELRLQGMKKKDDLMNEKQKHSELQGIEITDVGLDKIQVE